MVADLNTSLFAICQAMGSSLDLEEVLDTILDLTVQTFRADAGSILLYESGSDDLKMLASKGLPPAVVERGYVKRQGSPSERVIKENEPMILNAPWQEAEQADGVNLASAIRSSLCVPLRVKGQVIGTLNLNRYDPGAGAYDDSYLEAVMIVASNAAICIDNARLYRENIRQARLAAIGQTAAGISHCIKNMLTGLRGGISLVEMARQRKDWHALAGGAGILRRNVDRISCLMLDMLDFSREKKPVREKVDLRTLVDQALETVAYKAEKKKIALSRNIFPEGASLFVDPNQIFRCLLNLVGNAIDSIPSQGSVEVRSRQLSPEEARSALGNHAGPETTGTVTRLTVEDDGEGIEPENLESIFLPLFSTKSSRGTGLGLAVTKKIIDEHGGRIVVESTPGHGASFHITLPEKSPESPG